jgi:hypothetical protein
MTSDTLTSPDEMGVLRANHRPLKPRARSGISTSRGRVVTYRGE